jgi:hypothetical protein
MHCGLADIQFVLVFNLKENESFETKQFLLSAIIDKFTKEQHSFELLAPITDQLYETFCVKLTAKPVYQFMHAPFRGSNYFLLLSCLKPPIHPAREI